MSDTERKGWVHLNTADNRALFVETLAAKGTLIAAVDAVGCSRQQAYDLRKNDPTFAEECEIAMERYRNVLVAEAHRRAVEGTDKPVVHEGAITDTYKVYSDRLLELMLKRHIPEFREKTEAKVEHSGTVENHVLNLADLTREERAALRVLAKAAKPETNEMAARKRPSEDDA
jgi:hypothetical protein